MSEDSLKLWLVMTMTMLLLLLLLLYYGIVVLCETFRQLHHLSISFSLTIVYCLWTPGEVPEKSCFMNILSLEVSCELNKPHEPLPFLQEETFHPEETGDSVLSGFFCMC